MSRKGTKHHGYSGTPTHRSWQGILQRCTNPKCPDWVYYGARGIKVCDRWLEFHLFLADMGERPEGTSIDRVDHEGHYEPGNCVWSNIKTQNRNRRGCIKITIDGKVMPLRAACEKYDLKWQSVEHYKLYYNLSYSEAFLAVLNREIDRSLAHVLGAFDHV